MKKQTSSSHHNNQHRSSLQKQSLSAKQQEALIQPYHSTHAANYNSKFNYQRKCHTPSLVISHTNNANLNSKNKNHQKQYQGIKTNKNSRSVSKPKQSHPIRESKERLSNDKKANYYSIKSINKAQNINSSTASNFKNNNTFINSGGNMSSNVHQAPGIRSTTNKKSPFKHKNPNALTNKNRLNNYLNNKSIKNYHQSHLESDIVNMSDSTFKQQQKNDFEHETLGDSRRDKKNKKLIISANDHPLMIEGKNLMKNHLFNESIEIFKQYLKKLSNQNKSTPSLSSYLEAKYLLGVSHFHLNNYEQVIENLTEIMLTDDKYRKNVYLFLGISYKKLGLIDEALLIMGKGLKLYEKYTELLIVRAKLLAKQKRYYDSIEDLNKAIKLEPENIQSYISKADCLRNLTQYKEAISIYTSILKTHFSLEILLKRAITFIQNQQIQKSLADLSTILAKSPSHSQAYLFKGLAYNKVKNYNESILSYEQAIKYNTSKKATTKALYEIAKLKIETGDFYGASYTLQRASGLQIDTKVIEKLKTFTDGATFIMKKKYRRGIQLLHTLSKKEHLNEQILRYLFSFRAYGHFCLNKYASALADLKQMIKSGFVVDSASQYNLSLLEGIIKSQNNEFKEAMEFFNKTSKLRPDFGDPQIYKALCKVAEYNRTPKLRAKNQHLLIEALSFIRFAVSREPHYNYFYLEALLLYLLKDYPSALTSLEQAIQRSDDHVMKHFYLRALIKAMQEQYQQAYNDLNNVLSVWRDIKQKQKQKGRQGSIGNLKGNSQFDEIHQQKEILQVYLNRAKCYLLFGQKKKAFQDLQTYIGHKPLDNEIHTIAGKILFSIGACEDAIKAYNYSPNVQKNRESLLSRAKCYMLLKELNLALRDMQKLIELGNDKLINFDYCCLSALKQASKGQEQNLKLALQKINLTQKIDLKQGNIFSIADMHFYKGVFYFMLGQYESAKKLFLTSKNLKKINKQLQSLPSELHQTQINTLLQTQEVLQYFENRIYLDHQIDYNIALCQLMLNNIEKAKIILSQYSGFQKYLFTEQEYDENDEKNLTPFPGTNRLCSIFPMISYSENIKFSLSFCLPTIHPPPIMFETQYNLIEQINFTSVQSRPDAPWIKRAQNGGVIFTCGDNGNLTNLNNYQQGQMVYDDIDLKTQKSGLHEQDRESLKDFSKPFKDSNLQQDLQDSSSHKPISQSHRLEGQDFHNFEREGIEDKQEQINTFEAQKQRIKNMFLQDNQKLDEKMKKIQNSAK